MDESKTKTIQIKCLQNHDETLTPIFPISLMRFFQKWNLFGILK